jgi:hypothetical protein
MEAQMSYFDDWLADYLLNNPKEAYEAPHDYYGEINLHTYKTREWRYLQACFRLRRPPYLTNLTGDLLTLGRYILNDCQDGGDFNILKYKGVGIMKLALLFNADMTEDYADATIKVYEDELKEVWPAVDERPDYSAIDRIARVFDYRRQPLDLPAKEGANA